MNELVSQKAIGLARVGNKFLPHVGINVNATAQEVLETMRLLAKHIVPGSTQRVFVRPCPKYPNHGNAVAGYQSIDLERKGAMRQVVEFIFACKDQGVEADVVLMPFIKAKYSAVAAPGQYIIWGLGNDGVTAGHGQTVVLPVDPQENYSWLDTSGVPLSQAEVEYVAEERKIWGVQVRKAPAHLGIAAQPKGSFSGFLPTEKMEVKHLYVVNSLDELSELEDMKGLEAAPEGTLVIQPQGSMMSHAAAHCRGSGLGFVIAPAEAFKEGDILSQVAMGWVMIGDFETVPIYNPADYWDEFVSGLDCVLKDSVTGIELGTFFHQFSTQPITHAAIAAFLAGVFVKSLMSLGASAAVGEARYYRYITNDSEQKKVREAMVSAGIQPGYNRNQVYEKFRFSKLEMADVRGLAEFARRVHAHEKWQTGIGMGGVRWAVCAQNVIRVIDAIDAQDVPLIINRTNDLEHAVHNGGSLFNKFPGVPDALNRSTQPFRITPGFNTGNFPVVDAAFSALKGSVTPSVNKTWEPLLEAIGTLPDPEWINAVTPEEANTAFTKAYEKAHAYKPPVPTEPVPKPDPIPNVEPVKKSIASGYLW